MSFLFGKKKEGKEGKSSASPVSRDVHSAQGNTPPGPQVNGVRPKERGPGVSSPAPGAGVNSSISSIEPANIPSPDHGHDQRNLEHEIQVSKRQTRADCEIIRRNRTEGVGWVRLDPDANLLFYTAASSAIDAYGPSESSGSLSLVSASTHVHLPRAKSLSAIWRRRQRHFFQRR